MQYKVLFDRILVKRDSPPDEEMENTILMPHDVKKPPQMGIIIDIGSEVKYAKKDDRIAFNQYAGYFLHTTQDLAEPDLIVMREDEILAIIEED